MITGISREVRSPFHGVIGTASSKNEIVSACPQDIPLTFFAFGSEHAGSILSIDRTRLIGSNVKTSSWKKIMKSSQRVLKDLGHSVVVIVVVSLPFSLCGKKFNNHLLTNTALQAQFQNSIFDFLKFCNSVT